MLQPPVQVEPWTRQQILKQILQHWVSYSFPEVIIGFAKEPLNGWHPEVLKPEQVNGYPSRVQLRQKRLQKNENKIVSEIPVRRGTSGQWGGYLTT